MKAVARGTNAQRKRTGDAGTGRFESQNGVKSSICCKDGAMIYCNVIASSLGLAVAVYRFKSQTEMTSCA
ncbi:hypothetical protein BJV74DRAFT_812564 [Russula compacta]|nr:hypothetical protein BJV74DRAFT_812564 [Russula compacta]